MKTNFKKITILSIAMFIILIASSKAYAMSFKFLANPDKRELNPEETVTITMQISDIDVDDLRY